MEIDKNRHLQIDKFIGGVKQICGDISYEDIDKIVEELYLGWRRKSTVFLFGNGGSAATASHFTADLNNCTVTTKDAHPIRALSLADNITRFSALTNDEGWNKVYVSQLQNFFQAGDIAIGISVHGGSGQDRAGIWSQNLLSALQFAKDNGGKALGLTGFDGGVMKTLCDVCVNVPFNTTPHVEGFHAILTHLISSQLTERIKESSNRG